jgi:hypothetical protein
VAFRPGGDYAAIDPAIGAWADEHNLRLATCYKDYAVRSVEVARRRRWFGPRSSFQIWIDPPDAEGLVEVHAWDRASQRFERSVPLESVRAALEEALTWVRAH